MHRFKHPFRLRAKHAKAHHHRPGARRKVRHALVTAAALSFGLTGLARAETSPVGKAPTASSQTQTETPEARYARWKTDFDAFAETDRQHAPTPGGVLFVGSSSIRLWDSLEQDFKSLPVVTKRGFGGSRLSDVSDQVARLVLPYKPSVVIVYAGDNDLAEGATPSDVAGSFKRFVEQVRRDLPQTRIAYLSIKPSPSRASLIEEIRQTNDQIAAYTKAGSNLDYIDIYSKMLATDGRLRPELFREDMLHLNHEGYALWRQEISSHLDAIPGGMPNAIPGAGATVAAVTRSPAIAAALDAPPAAH